MTWATGKWRSTRLQEHQESVSLQNHIVLQVLEQSYFLHSAPRRRKAGRSKAVRKENPDKGMGQGRPSPARVELWGPSIRGSSRHSGYPRGPSRTTLPDRIPEDLEPLYDLWQWLLPSSHWSLDKSSYTGWMPGWTQYTWEEGRQLHLEVH